MSDTNDGTMKIGPRVPEDVWEKFKLQVEEKHGKVRGKIGEELAEALRVYMGDTDDQQVRESLEQITRRQEQLSLKMDDMEAELRRLRTQNEQNEQDQRDSTRNKQPNQRRR